MWSRNESHPDTCFWQVFRPDGEDMNQAWLSCNKKPCLYQTIIQVGIEKCKSQKKIWTSEKVSGSKNFVAGFHHMPNHTWYCWWFRNRFNQLQFQVVLPQYNQCLIYFRWCRILSNYSMESIPNFFRHFSSQLQFPDSMSGDNLPSVRVSVASLHIVSLCFTDMVR